MTTTAPSKIAKSITTTNALPVNVDTSLPALVSVNQSPMDVSDIKEENVLTAFPNGL